MSFRSEYCGELLRTEGFFAYYTLETARDMLLRRDPKRIYLLTNADLVQLAKLFSDFRVRRRNGEHGFLDSMEKPVYFSIDFPENDVVHMPGLLDRERNVLIHAARHELFTVDGFYYDLGRALFHDPLDAYSHLKKGVVHTVCGPEEAASLHPDIALKTAALHAQTGFEIDRPLSRFLKRAPVPSYEKPDRDALSCFLRILEPKDGRSAQRAFSMLDEWGVLEHILPEVTALKEVSHDKDHHPEGDGFHHTMRCLKCLKKPDRNLMMAALLHDTGKVGTRTRNGGFRFPNHSNESRKIAERILRRFLFSREDIEEISFLVGNHMVLNGVKRMGPAARDRLFSSPYFPKLLELYRADIESGYHSTDCYYEAARIYRDHKRKMNFKECAFF